MWLTGPKTPSVITKDQNHAAYRAVPGISDKLPTYNGKNLHLLIRNPLLLLINFKHNERTVVHYTERRRHGRRRI